MELQDRISKAADLSSVNDNDGLGMSATPWTQRRQLIPEDGQRQLNWNNMDTSGKLVRGTPLRTPDDDAL
jgi:hypothetical protein